MVSPNGMEGASSGYRTAVIDPQETRAGPTGSTEPVPTGSTTDSIRPDPRAGARDADARDGMWFRPGHRSRYVVASVSCCD
jgi:hypothetical protein